MDKKGRYTDYKCIYCGRYLPYDQRIMAVEYTPDSELTREQISLYHKKCKYKAMQGREETILWIDEHNILSQRTYEEMQRMADKSR